MDLLGDIVKTAMRDLVVLLPGIMGSTLAKDGKAVWAPSAGAVLRAIWTFGRSIKGLQLPEGVGDENPGDGVVPTGLMPDLHVLPGVWTANVGYGALVDWLRTRFELVEAPPDDPEGLCNFLPVPYDWRLSNRYNGKRLASLVEPALERWRAQGGEFADAKVVFLCHSMGGLVARWYVDKEGGAGLTRKLVTLGTPHRGSLKALEQLVNGVHVRLGPLAVDLTRFARSLPSLHQLLPEYACVEGPNGLLKTNETDVPELDTGMVSDAMRFHDELDAAWPAGRALHPVVGFRQPTSTTARIRGRRVVPVDTIHGRDERGDGTVPRLAATPRPLPPDSPSIRSAVARHGALQSSPPVLDEVEFVLGARSDPYRATRGIELGVSIDELVLEGDPVVLSVETSAGDRVRLRATARDEAGRERSAVLLGPGQPVELGCLPPGGYEVTVGGVGSGAATVTPVTCPVLVWGEARA